MNTFKEYQDLSKTTAIYGRHKALEYVVCGLVSEAGEVAGKLKKIIRDSGDTMSEEQRQDMIKEGGDCIWYLSQLFTELGYDFGQAAQDNIDKLLSRKERGVLSGSGDNR